MNQFHQAQMPSCNRTLWRSSYCSATAPGSWPASRRVYKDATPHEKAVQIMIEGRGSHFGLDIVYAFLDLQDEFKAIAARFCDSNQVISEKIKQPDHAIGEQP